MIASHQKMLILAILEILRKRTDADHRLKQADIIERLEYDYEMHATRKTVRASLSDLQDFGYPIEYRNGWYYEHEFCEAELNLIADSLLCNASIPLHQYKSIL